MERKIIHIDMDAFYASVEQRDNPKLKGKPIAVGSGSMRGVVAAASYEARKFGVHSAMPSVKAKRYCPNLIFVKMRMDVYRETSECIRNIFNKYTSLIEPLSLDEAYLDVTENKVQNPSATLIAEDIRRQIFKETGLTASAGVSYNKFLAKTASDINKPNGIFVITPNDAESFIDSLKIERFFGIGKVTAQKFHNMGVFFGADLKKMSEKRLIQTFGKSGNYYYKIARGIDNRLVNPHRERKSVGGEKTFLNDLNKLDDMKTALEPIAKKVYERMQQINKYGRTVTVKIKFSDFNIITRSKTQQLPIMSVNELLRIAAQQLTESYEPNFKVRLLGISVSNFLSDEQEAVQLEFEWE